MTPTQIIIGTIICILGLWFAVRIASTAFFKSKLEYMRTLETGKIKGEDDGTK